RPGYQSPSWLPSCDRRKSVSQINQSHITSFTSAYDIMGSSKKHKEKDKDRDRERRREKDRKHRDRDKEREKDGDRDKRRHDERHREKRAHGSDEETERIEKKKSKREEYDDLYEYAIEESTREDRSSDAQPKQEGGDISLSIEETNKLRIKLGLKPLEGTDSSGTQEENATSKKEDVHVPAINMADQKETEKFKRKLEEMKEKRRINKKLGKVKSLGTADSDDDDDSAMSWVLKSRKKENEKVLAEKRAQLLEEMDNEFGISDLMEEEFRSLSKSKKPTYSSQDLRGIKVEHSQEHFTEGSTVIMTLKDAGVLDEDEQTLVNVNIVDREKADKNVELRKRKPDYKPYDEPEIDEYGKVKQRGLLEKYDEEIDGEEKKSFVLGSGGTYDSTKEDEVKKIQAKLKAQMVSLEMAQPRPVAEYYTQEEMVKFKKPKKRRKIKKRETLKADDLEALPGQTDLHSDRGSRSVKSILKNTPKMEEREETGDMMELDPLEPEDDAVPMADTDNGAIVEDDEAQLELQLALERSRRLKQKKSTIGAEKVVEALATVIKKEKEEDIDNKDSIILNSTSEFCRTLGEIPTLSAPGEEVEEEDEDDNEWRMDVERDEEAEPQGGWEWVKTQEEKRKKEREEETENNILDAEPLVGKGVGAALFLASKKGLLEQNSKAKIEGKALPFLPSVGVVDEEKMREEERERGGRSSRHGGSSSKNKQEYKPDVKLEYYDDNGRPLTPKEAFRFMSHKFHGKASGKMKTEKRMKKQQDEMALQKMNSGDTPLNTAALLIEKQKNAQSPFVILSGGGQTFSTGTTISKRK
ncbi:hypothetical protein pdam_00012621, partial [Pocillopora damicornis]